MSVELMQAYYKTYNSEDSAALRKFYHEDVVLTSAQGEQNGADAIIGTYQYLIDLFHDQMTPTSIDIISDDGTGKITAQVKITDCFTAKKPVDDFMGQSLAIGESFELKLQGTYEIEGGRFKRIAIAMQ